MDETEEQETILEPVKEEQKSIDTTLQNTQITDLSQNTVTAVSLDDKLGDLAKKIESGHMSSTTEEIKPNLVVTNTPTPNSNSPIVSRPSTPQSPSKLSINFSNVDNVVNEKGQENLVSAPKDLETLEKIAEINNAKRKEEENDDKLTIGDDISAGLDTINLDNDPLLGDVVSL